MTKQEEIREWLENELDIHRAFKYSKQETARDILSYLHSQGELGWLCSSRKFNKGGVMLAQELIEKVVVPQYQDKAYVRATILDEDSWWHVHRGEELPKGKAISVVIRP